MTNISNSLMQYARAKDDLLAAYPELADDEEALNDTLDGITDACHDMDKLYNLMRKFSDISKNIGERMSEMAVRKKRYEARSSIIRDTIAKSMQDNDVKKITTDFITLSVRDGNYNVEIIDENIIPDEFVTEVITRKPDKKKMKDHMIDIVGLDWLGDGLVNGIDGARLIKSGPILTIRTK